MEKRSARARKVHNYAHLDGDSDEEFFDDKPPKPKIPASTRKDNSDDDDWQFGSGSDQDDRKKESKTSKSKKQSKKDKPAKVKKAVVVTTPSELSTLSSTLQKQPTPGPILTPASTSATKLIPPTTPVIPQGSVGLKTPRSVPSIKPKTPQSAPPCLANSPLTPASSSSLRSPYAVTPTSGLRIGLSRNQKPKPLHSNVRVV